MKTKFYKVKRRLNDIVKIDFRENAETSFISFGTNHNNCTGNYIIENVTKKGFYYQDIFFNRIYVTWNTLEEINL